MNRRTGSHITVCVCTFRRPAQLQRLLRELDHQQTANVFSYSVVTVDNDPERSAEVIALQHAAQSQIEVLYCCEPRQNIALARNKALEHADGDYVAFIDDDEFPQPDWLLKMLATCEQNQVAGVLGPVRPFFEQPPPRWIIDGGFCERPEFSTGRPMQWEECRTGNVLFRRSIIDKGCAAFDARFNNGGEDKDFFMRMSAQGHEFCWCNEGVTYEIVPPNRWTRRYMLRRALLRGKNILKHPIGRGRLISQSIIAVPLYSLALPMTLPFGQHVFMKYCIKLCDHLGRISALAHLNIVSER